MYPSEILAPMRPLTFWRLLSTTLLVAWWMRAASEWRASQYWLLAQSPDLRLLITLGITSSISFWEPELIRLFHPKPATYSVRTPSHSTISVRTRMPRILRRYGSIRFQEPSWI